MPDTKEQMKRRRVDAGDEGRAKDAVRKKRQRAEAGDEGRANDAVRKKRRRAEAGDEVRANDAVRKKRQRVEAGDEVRAKKQRVRRGGARRRAINLLKSAPSYTASSRAALRV